MRQNNRVVNVIPFLILLVLPACDYSYEAQTLQIDDTYHGTTADGDEIVLMLKSEKEGLSGYGTFGKNEIVFVEGGPAKVTGKLILPDGEVLPATMTFSGGENISLELADQTLSMISGGTVVKPAGGPFSGYYETQELQSLLEALSLTQSGDIISGTALVLGQKVLVSGWLVAPDSVYGRVILPDETEMEITAHLNDKNDLIVTGLGQPVAFQRR